MRAYFPRSCSMGLRARFTLWTGRRQVSAYPGFQPSDMPSQLPIRQNDEIRRIYDIFDEKLNKLLMQNYPLS